MLCDRFHCHRLFFIMTGILSPLLFLVIRHLNSVPGLLLCAVVCGAVLTCMLNMSGSWVSSLRRDGITIDFGVARSCGSFSFAIMALLYGRAISRFGDSGLTVLMAACGLLCVLLSFGIPQNTRSDSSRNTVSRERIDLSSLLKNRPYRRFLLIGFLSMVGLAGSSVYYVVLLTQLGADSVVVGIGNFAYAIAEVPAMLLFTRIRRKLEFRTVLLISLLAVCLQSFGLGIAHSCTAAILSMLLQGLSYGLMVPLAQQFVDLQISEECISSAQMTCTAVVFTASMILGSILCGALVSVFSLSICFRLMALLSFAAVLLFAVFRRSLELKKNSDA